MVHDILTVNICKFPINIQLDFIGIHMTHINDKINIRKHDIYANVVEGVGLGGWGKGLMHAPVRKHLCQYTFQLKRLFTVPALQGNIYILTKEIFTGVKLMTVTVNHGHPTMSDMK